MSRPKNTKTRESTEERYIRSFIDQVCEGNLAKANVELDGAVKEKLKSLIQNEVKEIK